MQVCRPVALRLRAWCAVTAALVAVVFQSAASADSSLVNISTRSPVATGDSLQVAGFVIEGTAAKTVLIRGAGPALASYDVAPFLADPVLTLLSGQAPIATNDDWSRDPTAAALIRAAATRVGAFAWAEDSRDAALLVTLPPGIYTATVSGKAGASGVALVEIYDADLTPAGSHLVNLSTRFWVGRANEAQIAGLVVAGPEQRTMLIRGAGPALASLGVSGCLADPVLSLHNGSSPIAINDDWDADLVTGARIKAAARRVGAFDWAEGSGDAALLVTLDPGVYTATVTGRDGGTGVALVEVYTADPPVDIPDTLAVGVHSVLEYGTPFGLDPHVAQLRSIGVQVSRNDFLWDQIEPTPGHYDWTTADAMVNALLAAGIEPLMVVWGSPAWANGSNDRSVVPTDESAFTAWLEAYRNFVRRLAARYLGRVSHWELWNEPNVSEFWKPVPDVAGYARWAAAIEAEIRAVDPAARVAWGSLTIPEVAYESPGQIAGADFLRELYDRGCSPQIVSVHPYAYNNEAPESGGAGDGINTFRDVETIRKVMTDHGGTTGTQMWITEFCWWAGTDPYNPSLFLTEQEQADFLARALALVRTWPFVTRAVWFWDRDRPGAKWNGAGLLREDGSMRPAAAVMSDFAAGGGPDPSSFAAPPPPRVVRTGTKFGLLYSTPGFDWLGSHYRFPFVQRAVARDFAIMASLDVETIKLRYQPADAFVFTENGGGRLRTAALVDYEPTADDQIAFVPATLQWAVDFGIEPTVGFMTNELYCVGPNGPYWHAGPMWYEYAYQNGPGYRQMARDLAQWETGLLRAIESSPAHDFIYYINLSTEMPFSHAGADGTALADAQAEILTTEVVVPPDQRAMDAFTGVYNPYTGHFLDDSAATRLAQLTAAAGAPLAFTEVHPYPDLYDDEYPGYPAYVPGPVEPSLVRDTTAASIELLRALFAAANPPGVTTVVTVGEAGASYVYYGTEAGQADAFEALWQGSQAAPAFYYTFGLWDVYTLGDPVGVDIGRLGFGFSADQPRDIFGRVVEMRSDLAGGDFETGTSGWIAGSTAPDGASLSWHAGKRADAATGLHCLRLTVTRPGLAWLQSPGFGLHGSRAALSGYVRTNASQLTAALYTCGPHANWNATPLRCVVPMDAASLEKALLAYRWDHPPSLLYFDPANPWRFYQLQNLIPGTVFELPANSTGGVVCFSVWAPPDTSITHPIHLDIDSVSIHAFSPLGPDF